MKKLILLSLGAIFILTSCRKDILAEAGWKFGSHGWVQGDVKSFEMSAEDTTTRYSMDVDLDWLTTYPYENIYVKISTTYPSGKEVSSVVSFEMAESDGSWSGDCSGDHCTLHYTIQDGFTFPEKGTYQWSIEPYMRIDTLAAIRSLEVTCLKQPL